MEDFCVALAGVPVRIRCRFEGNKAFLSDYVTDGEPLFTVEPTEDDLLRMQADFDRMDEAEGIPRHRRTEEFLENSYEKTSMRAIASKSNITVGSKIIAFPQLAENSNGRTGTAIAINDDFTLKVRFDDGSVEDLRSGEVSVRGLYGYT